MLFNKRARDLAIEDNKFALMHDFWVGISVDSVNGVIISLPIPTILYRQHANNTIGASKKKKDICWKDIYIFLILIIRIDCIEC